MWNNCGEDNVMITTNFAVTKNWWLTQNLSSFTLIKRGPKRAFSENPITS